ncbi:MAG: hypothetical protein EAZ95_05225 [Bacteroidetes bacterium]|nr:MAG: hypothetical protein EAZ95_05225 [Bacteroidota bacterium]
MKKFLQRFAFFALPMVMFQGLLLWGYWHYDPFRVCRAYKTYSGADVTLNRDYVSTELLIRKYPRYRYDSFIFGSSRTLAFQPASWERLLPQGSKAFSFDASSERLYGIHQKIRYLDAQNIPIKNALVVLCRDASFVPMEHTLYIFRKHPITSGESWARFHWALWCGYMDFHFLITYYRYQFTQRCTPDMQDIINKGAIELDSVSNATLLVKKERELVNPDEYYKKYASIFYTRASKTTEEASCVQPVHIQMLQEIKAIFEKHKTNYRVIMSPLYEQKKMSKADKENLEKIFDNRFFDFSGKNFFTEDKRHYYETSHYRPMVGDSIMKIVQF